jgi:Fur family ferric uptake transcriptional regulator
MNHKSQYQTKQGNSLLEYLGKAPGRHFTVQEICAYFKNQDVPIGMTTVYRQLDKLVREGTVKKCVVDRNSPACYVYTEDTQPEVLEGTVHCLCDRCGKLIHLHCSELAGLKEHLSEHHGFELNITKTVFYGICEECRAKEAGYETSL